MPQLGRVADRYRVNRCFGNLIGGLNPLNNLSNAKKRRYKSAVQALWKRDERTRVNTRRESVYKENRQFRSPYERHTHPEVRGADKSIILIFLLGIDTRAPVRTSAQQPEADNYYHTRRGTS